MQEIIHSVDSWSIIKIVGGLGVVIVGASVFLSKLTLKKFTQHTQHHYDKKLEDIKGEINKNNNLLDSLVQNYLSTSQKILDKKIQTYELLWTTILGVKNALPSGIGLVYDLLVDSEMEKSTAFEDLDNNPKMGSVLRSYNMDKEMLKLVDNGKELHNLKPYITDTSYKLFQTYIGLVGRVTHMFIWDYQRKKLYNWKSDKNLNTILKMALTDAELTFVKKTKIAGLRTLMDLLEYKIIQDFRVNLNIRVDDHDTIKYLKELQNIVNIQR